MKLILLALCFSFCLLNCNSQNPACEAEIPAEAKAGNADTGGSGLNTRIVKDGDVVSNTGGGSNTYFVSAGGTVFQNGGGSHLIYLKNDATLNISGGGGSIRIYHEPDAIINNELSGGGDIQIIECSDISFN